MIKLITDKRGRQIAVLKNDTHISKWVEETGQLCHDDSVRNFILPLLRPGMFVVDVGAHIGDHTAAYAEAVGDSGHVYALEPHPWAFACLALNVADCPNVSPFCFGAGDREEITMMALNRENVGASYVTYGIGERAGMIPVPIAPLDILLSGTCPNFIKMDIEGWEFTALVGGLSIIRRAKPLIVCEINRGALGRNCVSPGRLIKLITDLGYDVRPLDPNHTLDQEQVDVLFTPT